MPTTDIHHPLTTAIKIRQRELIARLEEAGSRSLQDIGDELIHRAVDGGLSDRVLSRLVGAEGKEFERSAESPRLVWALCRARWDADDWEGVRGLALHVMEHTEWMTSPGWARTVIRAAWSDLLRADLKGEFLCAVHELRLLVNQTGGPLPLVADLAHLDAYRALVHGGDSQDCIILTRLAAANYHHLGESSNETKGRILAARALLIRGELNAASRECERAVETARGIGNAKLLIHALNAWGTAKYRRGDFEGALRCFRDGRALAEEFEESRWKFALEANRARCLAMQGRWQEAEEILDRLAQEDHSAQAAQVTALLAEYQGLVHLAARRFDAALACFEECDGRLRSASIQSYERWEVGLRRAEALIGLERFVEAYEASARSLEGIRASGDRLEEGHLLRVQAKAAGRMGRPTESVRLFEESIEALRRVGDAYTLALALLDRAECLRIEDRRAIEDVDEATSLLRRMACEGALRRARRLRAALEREFRRRDAILPPMTSGDGADGGVIAVSASTRALLADAKIAARSRGPALLLGETGTGKEVLARFIHRHGPHASGPFVPVNCAAIPESLFEREFFGNKRGAFTGADREAPGLVQAADGGTLFLDEIGEMPLSLQPKLLRLLQEGTYRRVGDAEERSVRIRVVAATNRSLLEGIGAGEFREDLYYRLSCFVLRIAPLREREEDLVEFVRRFLRRAEEEQGTSLWMERDVWQRLRRHRWPGNIRELESVMVSASARTDEDGRLGVECLPHQFAEAETAIWPRGGGDRSLAAALESHERSLILEALRSNRYCRTGTARALGIGRNTLYEKMKRLGIRPERTSRASF